MTDHLHPDTLPWLLQPDDPGVRYLALRDLCGLPPDHPDLTAARQAAHAQGPIAVVLDGMHPEGWWAEPGPGYNPKYRSTVWAMVLLAQLGASPEMDARIPTACDHLLAHALAPGGQFATNTAPSGTADCLQGNMCAALLDLGCADPRLDAAFEWMARTVTGEGIAPKSERDAPVRYFAGKCGPLFACGANNNLPCAWGAAKVMLAFGKLPAAQRTPLILNAIQAGVDFFFGVDLAGAAWPSGWADKPSGNWWKFGFPVFYITDLLQVVEALVGLGYANDPRLVGALELVRSKQDERGRWLLEYDYTGKTWVDFGPRKQPNKWVSLRAARVLKAAGWAV